MKKIAAVLTALTVIFSSLTFIGAAQAKTNENDLQLLKALGILTERNIQNADAEITRAQFAIFTAKLAGLDADMSTTRYFTDVLLDSTENGYISALASNNIITTDARLFRPNDAITLIEAEKMLLCAAGYYPYAEAAGGYPKGYIKLAADLKIAPGVQNNLPDLYDCAEMMVNILEAPLMDASKVKDGDVVYEKQPGECLLERVFDVSFTEGTVQAVYALTIDENIDAEKNTAVVADEIYREAPDFSLRKLVGNYVKLYYRKTERDSIGTVIYAAKKGNREDVVIDGDDIEAYECFSVSYTRDGSIRHVDFSQYSIISYNGRVLTTDYNSAFTDIDYGRVIVKDSDADGTYDVVIIEDYHDFIPTQTDIRNEKIYDRYSSAALELDYFDYLMIYDYEGNEITISELEKAAVLSVAQSKDAKTLTIYMSDKSNEGIITSLEAEERKISVGNASYTVTKECMTLCGDCIKSGKNVLIFINCFGSVSYITEQSPSSMLYGYIYDWGNENKGLKDKLGFRLLNENGELLTLLCGDTVKVDGIKTDNENIKAQLPCDNDEDGNPREFQPQLIRYSQNENGEINAIDSFEQSETENEKASLIRSQQPEILTYKNFRFGLKTMTNGYATRVFFVPEDKVCATEDESEFAVSGLWTAGFEADNKYNIEAYKYGTDSDFPSIIVCRGGNLTQAYDEIILVDKVIEARNESDDWVKMVCGIQRNKFVQYEADDDVSFDSIGQGDLIRCMMNRGKKVTKLNVLYDYSTGGLPTWGGVNTVTNWFDPSYNQFFQLSYGYVTEKGEQVVKWGYKDYGIFDEEYNLAILPIMVYDPSRSENKVYSGTINDIYDYRTCGDKCSRIIFKTVYSNGSCAVIYNDQR